MTRTTLLVAICCLWLAAPAAARARDAEEYRTLIEMASTPRPGYEKENWPAVTALNDEMSESGVNEVLYNTALEMYRAGDSSSPVRNYCMGILANSGTEEAFGIVAPLAREGNWRALEVLVEFGERSVPIYEEALDKYDGYHPGWVCAVGALVVQTEVGVPILLDHLSDQLTGKRPPERVQYLLEALGSVDDARATPIVLELSRDARLEVRRGAYKGLPVPRDNFNEPPHFNPYKMDDYATVKAIEEAARKGLEDPDEVIRAESIRILGEMAYVKEDLSFVGYLEQQAQSASTPIRQAAQWALEPLREVQKIREDEKLGRAGLGLTETKPKWWHEWREQEGQQRSPRGEGTE